MGPLSGEELAAWVAASCAAQGVALKITDLGVIKRVQVLLGAGGGGGGSRVPTAPLPPPTRPLQPPHRGDSVGIELGGMFAGADDSVVEHGTDDGDLLDEV